MITKALPPPFGGSSSWRMTAGFVQAFSVKIRSLLQHDPENWDCPITSSSARSSARLTGDGSTLVNT
jgi:hypothetical protein